MSFLCSCSPHLSRHCLQPVFQTSVQIWALGGREKKKKKQKFCPPPPPQPRYGTFSTTPVRVPIYVITTVEMVLLLRWQYVECAV